MEFDITRRSLLAAGAVLLPALASERPKLKVAIFSKHLHFVQGEDLAKVAAEMGFDGIDITVRKGGHVEPERVRQELPGLVSIIRKHGLEVPMITTDIVDTETPHTENLLKTMADLGIPNYRWGGFKYASDQPYEAQLNSLKPRVAKLAAISTRYQVCGMYHTHSGPGVVGASIWDLYILLRDVDPKALGVNYDVAHATIEGGSGGWINSFQITVPHLRGIAIKDFSWGRDTKGNWQAQWKPIGEGMVHFPQFFAMLAASGFNGPTQLHLEYQVGGLNSKAPIVPNLVFDAMKRDLGRVRGYLAQANL